MHLIECQHENEMIKSPISAILIEHPVLGNILYDTGNSPFFSKEYSKYVLDTYPIPEFISIESALKEKGLTLADINMIIISHLHFDHAGGLRYFVGTQAIKNVFVSETELKNAYFQTMTDRGGVYIKSLLAVDGIVYKPVEEDMQLADDIGIFIQNSHTPGVMGLLLKTKSKGNIIVTSDTIYTAESYDKELPPGSPINKTKKEFYDNLKKIKDMKQKYSAELLFGHDYEQTIAWNKEGRFE